MATTPDPPRLRIRIAFGRSGMIGPGKAELLERIARTGSIAAAGREMGMSYRRAWMLVDGLNAMFDAPLVDRSRGGAKGGGATLTEAGRATLAEYRAIEAEAHAATSARRARLLAMLKDMPD